MSVLPVTRENFESVVSQDGIVFLDCWADWCQPCRMFRPVYDKAAEKHTDITFGSIDTEAEPELFASFGVSSIPTIVAIRDGIPVFMQPGAMSTAQFEQVIQAVRDLDMDKVKAELAEHSH